MDDPLLVRVLHRLDDREKHLQALAQGQEMGGAVPVQGDSVDSFHDEVRTAVFGFAGVEDARDIRVIENRERLPLGFETSKNFARVHPRLDEFDRDRTLDRLILLGGVDDAHAAFPERVQNSKRTDSSRVRDVGSRRGCALEEGRAGGLGMFEESFDVTAKTRVTRAPTLEERVSFPTREFVRLLEKCFRSRLRASFLSHRSPPGVSQAEVVHCSGEGNPHAPRTSVRKREGEAANERRCPWSEIEIGQSRESSARYRRGKPHAAGELLPLVYEELRKLARARMSNLPPGHTLQPTALVHEVWLRLVGDAGESEWNSRNHFFAAAAESMRQILVDHARRKYAKKRGGDRARVSADEIEIPLDAPMDSEEMLAVDRALERLEGEDPRKATILKLRYFVGLTRQEVADALGLSLRTVDYEWRYLVARLHMELHGGADEPNG